MTEDRNGAVPPCIIVTPAAADFAAALDGATGGRIPAKVCTTSEELRAQYAGESILFGNPAMIASVLDDLPGVRWVQSTWAGVTPLTDHARRDYLLTGVKGVFGPQMSEYTLGYLLAHELRIRERREAQTAHRWDKTQSGLLASRCLGVMGTGSIGADIAASAAALGMRTIGLSRSGRAAPGFEKVYTVAELHEFLAACDHCVSTLPSTAETDALLDAAALACLPPHAVFVNVGRSNVVVDDALIAALRAGQLAGAVLDVFDEEPLPEDSPLWDAPGLTVTAHIAAISHPDLIVPIFVDNHARFAAGEALRYVVDFDAGY